MSKIKSIRVAYAESQTANQKPENLNFSAPYNERTLIGRNPIGMYKKRGKWCIKQKSNVSTVDIQIKRSVFKVSSVKLNSSFLILSW